jgi:hypothetical protein
MGLKGTPHPHALLAVGVRGPLADDAFMALEVRDTLDFDGVLAIKEEPMYLAPRRRDAEGKKKIDGCLLQISV